MWCSLGDHQSPNSDTPGGPDPGTPQKEGQKVLTSLLFQSRQKWRRGAAERPWCVCELAGIETELDPWEMLPPTFLPHTCTAGWAQVLRTKYAQSCKIHQWSTETDLYPQYQIYALFCHLFRSFFSSIQRLCTSYLTRVLPFKTPLNRNFSAFSRLCSIAAYILYIAAVFWWSHVEEKNRILLWFSARRSLSTDVVSHYFPQRSPSVHQSTLRYHSAAFFGNGRVFI